MKTETTKRILAALITIPIAISLTGCGGQDSKKSEPVKPAVTSSQSVKEDKAAKEKAQAEAKAKAEAAAKAQAQATPAPQKPAVKQVQKPAVQQTRKPAPARQYRAPKKPAPRPKTHSGNNGGGYKLKPYEKSFDKNDLDADGNITGGGDEFGNTW
ncbi:hypothetical protein HMPREF1862_01788 [Varibaculum cambriense]|uniref:Lipoprotein n=1 Tax=Varibaculum cambriense TaxID=184870 RepID=A0AB34WXP8_9ACTO|nr:hypothetical protein [Varibaculum cambriense]KXB79468.1 hypothetical protein HMPREF1862_01788 [Varibaculum cambriense]